jgi:hypothetical protein
MTNYFYNYLLNRTFHGYTLCINQKITNSFTFRFFSQMNSGISETTRENIFNFDLYYHFISSSSYPIVSFTFLTWFIGFSEADGGWYLKDNNKIFIIRQKDVEPLNYIYNNFKFGHISF